MLAMLVGEADEEVGLGVGWDEWAEEMGQPEMGFVAWAV